MITLQTLPIELLLDNHWNTIEEVCSPDSVRDFLQSPTIDCFDGLLFRAVKNGNIIESFVWNNDRWHDLSSKGKFFQKFPLGDNKKFIREYGYPEAWRICGKCPWLIGVIDRVEMTHFEHFKFADDVIVACSENDEYDDHLRALRAEAKILYGSKISQHETYRIREAINRRYPAGFRHASLDDKMKAIEYLACVLTSHNDYRFAKSCSIAHACKFTKRNACDILRGMMPLHRVIQEYFKP